MKCFLSLSLESLIDWGESKRCKAGSMPTIDERMHQMDNRALRGASKGKMPWADTIRDPIGKAYPSPVASPRSSPIWMSEHYHPWTWPLMLTPNDLNFIDAMPKSKGISFLLSFVLLFLFALNWAMWLLPCYASLLSTFQLHYVP